ncbi:MAG TPA: beta-galactosidase domain 4-containing protein [Puia sp.]|nr:beta-galactosidase domain 4-containing protein [Puia sp.]
MKRLELTAVLLLCYALVFPQTPPSPAPAWDRTKNCQPVITRLASPDKYPYPTTTLGVQIFNAYLSHSLSNLQMEWNVTLNGSVVQKGKAPLLTIGPQRSGSVRLPVKMPTSPGEVFLNVYYRLKKAQSTLPAGSIVAREQLRLREYADDLSIHPAGELSFIDEGGTFTITSSATTLNLQFNKQTGWLQHYAIGQRLLAEDSLGLVTALDQNPGSVREPRLQLFSTSTSTDLAVVKADYLIPETPFLLHDRYTVNAKGEMQVEQVLEVDTTQPRDTTMRLQYPPLFGMKWKLPAGPDSVQYYGTVPVADSCHTSEVRLYKAASEDTAARTDVRWCKFLDGQGHGLLIEADSSLLSISLTGRQLYIGANHYHYIYKVTPQ